MRHLSIAAALALSMGAADKSVFGNRSPFQPRSVVKSAPSKLPPREKLLFDFPVHTHKAKTKRARNKTKPGLFAHLPKSKRMQLRAML